MATLYGNPEWESETFVDLMILCIYLCHRLSEYGGIDREFRTSTSFVEQNIRDIIILERFYISSGIQLMHQCLEQDLEYQLHPQETLQCH